MKFIKSEIFFYWIERALSFFLSLKGLFVSFLVLFSVFVNFMFISYPFKVTNWLDKAHKKKSRQTLSRAEGPLTEIGIDIRVLKIKQGNKIYLEFLSKKPNNSYWFINSIELKGSREAYFDYHGEPGSILLVDANRDGLLDVIAPTFDKFFWPHKNLVVYNEETEKFELNEPEPYPKVIAPQHRKNFFSCGFWCVGD